MISTPVYLPPATNTPYFYVLRFYAHWGDGQTREGYSKVSAYC
jgi:hypothetical protein